VLGPGPPLRAVEDASEADETGRRRLEDAEDRLAEIGLQLIGAKPRRGPEANRSRRFVRRGRVTSEECVDKTIRVLVGDLAAVDRKHAGDRMKSAP